MRYASYWRSGSHYLGLLLKSHFYGSQEIYGVMQPYEGHAFQGVNAEGLCDWASLFIGHPSSPTQKADIYVVRDGRDVMVSHWRLDGQGQCFSDFLRDRLPTWYAVTNSWKGHPCVIHYEDLVARPDEVMDILRARFHLMADPWEHSTNKPVGYAPSSSRPISPFTEGDVDYFNSVVKDRWTLCAS